MNSDCKYEYMYMHSCYKCVQMYIHTTSFSMHFTGLRFVTDNYPLLPLIRPATINISDSEDEVYPDLEGSRESIELKARVKPGAPVIPSQSKRITTV